MFNPWKGAAWGVADNVLGGTRLMILGESHYCDPASPELVGQCTPETTVDVVEDLAIKGRHRFFTGLTQIVSGRPKWQMTPQEVEALWSAIAFANYVPVFVATGPRVRPTREMFERGHAAFVAMLAELEPQAILVCGSDLWWWMRRGWFGEAPPAADTCWIGEALAIAIPHPSGRGFSSTKVRPRVVETFAKVRSEIK